MQRHRRCQPWILQSTALSIRLISLKVSQIELKHQKRLESRNFPLFCFNVFLFSSGIKSRTNFSGKWSRGRHPILNIWFFTLITCTRKSSNHKTIHKFLISECYREISPLPCRCLNERTRLKETWFTFTVRVWNDNSKYFDIVRNLQFHFPSLDSFVFAHFALEKLYREIFASLDNFPSSNSSKTTYKQGKVLNMWLSFLSTEGKFPQRV